MSGGPHHDAEALAARLADVENQLREANETLDAIRNGEVDAVVVGGASGQVVYTLENADRPYRVLVEEMKEGALTLKGDGIILYCNQAFAKLVGTPSERITGSNILKFVDERAQVEAMLANRSASTSAEVNLLTPDGKNPVNLSIAQMDLEADASRILCGVITDLRQNYLRAQERAFTNAQLAEEIAERTKAEESLAIALEAADMGHWELSHSEQEASRSARHDAIFGYDTRLEHWDLATAIEHFIPEDRSAVRAAFEFARLTGKVEFERRIRRASDSALRWVHVKGRTFSENGEQRVVGIITDSTDRRLIDDQLRQAQKMEAVGQLTGGIAHDFNNLLMIIGGSLEALARRVVLEPRAKALLQAAQQGVARGAKLNEQLLAFARRQDMQVEPICVNDLLPNFETLLDRALGETVNVVIERDPELWHCATDPHQLETAILNLAINARDAMQSGGLVALSTTNETVSEAHAETFDAAGGDYVVVALRDNGSGMPADVIAHVFEPFFTTKEVGRGTGLGLSQVYGFAKQSGGFVSIDSQVGTGTTVAIHLPRVAAPRVTQQPQVVSTTGGVDYGVVLLVEDDADVRAASSAMLEELGYSVRQAASASEALDALRADDKVDVLFTDVIMSSGMNGVELARAVHVQWPGLPILLTSGYTAQQLAPSATNGSMSLLRKPYTIEELAHVMRSTVQSRDTAPPRSMPEAVSIVSSEC